MAKVRAKVVARDLGQGSGAKAVGRDYGQGSG